LQFSLENGAPGAAPGIVIGGQHESGATKMFKDAVLRQPTGSGHLVILHRDSRATP